MALDEALRRELNKNLAEDLVALDKPENLEERPLIRVRATGMSAGRLTFCLC